MVKDFNPLRDYFYKPKLQSGIGLVIQSVYYQPLVIRNLKPLEAANNST